MRLLHVTQSIIFRECVNYVRTISKLVRFSQALTVRNLALTIASGIWRIIAYYVNTHAQLEPKFRCPVQTARIALHVITSQPIQSMYMNANGYVTMDSNMIPPRECAGNKPQSYPSARQLAGVGTHSHVRTTKGGPLQDAKIAPLTIRRTKLSVTQLGIGNRLELHVNGNAYQATTRTPSALQARTV